MPLVPALLVDRGTKINKRILFESFLYSDVLSFYHLNLDSYVEEKLILSLNKIVLIQEFYLTQQKVSHNLSLGGIVFFLLKN